MAKIRRISFLFLKTSLGATNHVRLRWRLHLQFDSHQLHILAPICISPLPATNAALDPRENWGASALI